MVFVIGNKCDLEDRRVISIETLEGVILRRFYNRYFLCILTLCFICLTNFYLTIGFESTA